MIELIPFPDTSAPTLEGKVQKIEQVLYDLVQRYNRNAQQINAKEKNNGNVENL